MSGLDYLLLDPALGVEPPPHQQPQTLDTSPLRPDHPFSTPNTSAFTPCASSTSTSAPTPVPAPPPTPHPPTFRPPYKRLRKTSQERADTALRKNIRRPDPVAELEGDDEEVLARLKEITPERVREIQASLVKQERRYAEAYAALAAELKRAQVEEAVLANLIKVQAEEHNRVQYEAVASRVATRRNREL